MNVEIPIFDSKQKASAQPSLIFQDTKTGDLRIVHRKYVENGYNKFYLGIVTKKEIKRLARSC